MKRLLLLLCLLVPATASAQQTVFVPLCAGTNDTARFTAIITAIGANTGTIRLPYKKSTAGSQCAVNNLTIPANITLDNTGGTGIKVNTNWTLTVVGPVISPPKPLFLNATAGLGTVSFSGNKSIERFYPQWWGATGDGTTDDRLPIQASMTASGTAGGGRVHFVATANGYLVTGSVRPSSNTTISGDGYGSQIKCPTAGWTLVAVSNMGIINIDNKSNVRVTGLRVTGTNSVATGTTAPKLIYLEGTLAIPLSNITIDHCYLDTSVDEGIWQGGTQAYTTGVTVTDNYFTNISYKGTTHGGLPALQLNVNEGVVANNRFYQVGNAIGVSGYKISVTGNFIQDISNSGIETGDSTEIGNITISGNAIDFFESSSGSPNFGIKINGALTTDHLVTVSVNSVRMIGTAGLGTGTCYSAETGPHVLFVGNVAEIQVRGTGFNVLGLTTGAYISFKTNVTRLVAESGASSAFVGRPNGAGKTLNLISENNRAYGFTRAQGSYAFDFNTTGGGTLVVSVAGDFSPEGNIRIGDAVYAAGELDSKFIYDSNDFTASPHFLRSPKIGMLNLQAKQNSTVSAGVITLVGTAASAINRRTLIAVDTEGAAGTDDLDTINGGIDGDIIIVSSVADGRDTTLKDGTGNIESGTDFTLATTKDRIVLLYNSTLAKWLQLSRSTN